MDELDNVKVQITFSIYQHDEAEDEFMPCMEVLFEGDKEPIKFLCDHVFETEEGATELADVIERVIRTGTNIKADMQ